VRRDRAVINDPPAARHLRPHDPDGLLATQKRAVRSPPPPRSIASRSVRRWDRVRPSPHCDSTSRRPKTSLIFTKSACTDSGLLTSVGTAIMPEPIAAVSSSAPDAVPRAPPHSRLLQRHRGRPPNPAPRTRHHSHSSRRHRNAGLWPAVKSNACPTSTAALSRLHARARSFPGRRRSRWSVSRMVRPTDALAQLTLVEDDPTTTTSTSGSTISAAPIDATCLSAAAASRFIRQSSAALPLAVARQSRFVRRPRRRMPQAQHGRDRPNRSARRASRDVSAHPDWIAVDADATSAPRRHADWWLTARSVRTTSSS